MACAASARQRRLTWLCSWAIAALTSCRGSRVEADAKPHEATLVVFAAASLREAFEPLALDFERSHPGVQVTLNFAGTQELRTQLEHGASVDVFASADERHLQALRAEGRVEALTVFAENEPVIVVSSEKAALIRSLSDLPQASRLVFGAEQVPIGKYTTAILDRASLALGSDFRARTEARVVSRELNVRQVLAKVTLGEADAGIVYRSDVAVAKNRVSVVSIAADANVIARYPIAIVKGAAHPNSARDWIGLVLSAAGRRALISAGFKLPARPTGEP